MKNPLRTSLANRIIAMVAVITAVLTGLFIVYYTLHGRSTLEKYARDSGLAFAQSLAQSSLLGVMAAEPTFLEQPFEIAMSNPEVAFIAAYDASGSIVRQASRFPLNLALPEQSFRKLMEASEPVAGKPLWTTRGTVEDFFAPVVSEVAVQELSEELLAEPGEPRATTANAVGLIRVGFSREKITEAQRTSTIVGLVIGLSVLAFGLLVTFVLGRRITDPLKALEAGTNRISEGDLDVTLEVKTEDEVGTVARAFNAMAAALRATTVSKDYVDNIVGSMNEAMVVVDAERRIETMNAAMERLLGYSAAELKGTAVDALFAEASAHPFAATKWPRVIARAASNLNAEYRSKVGHRIPVSVSSAPMVDSHGNRRGLVIIARDMREINSLLEQLRTHASELERYQSVLLSMLDDNEQARAETESERLKTLAAVDSMTEGLVMFTATGADVALINPSAKSMLGLDVDGEVTPAQIVRMLGPALEPFIAGHAGIAGDRLIHDIAIEAPAPRIIRVEGIPVGQEGRGIGTMLVMRDITKERRLDEAKYELISNVSHELRTPLAIISNIVSNLLVGIAGPLPEKVQTNLETCSANTQRLAHIIDGLLSTASLDAGQVTLRRARTDVGSLVRALVDAYREEAARRGLMLELDLPQADILAYLDPKIIHDVLENLVTNALRYTGEGGKVSVSALRKASGIEFAVTDTGIGIPPDEQSSIFEHFHQVGRTYGPGEKGVGLGLSISRLLVQRHNGSIGVASRPGKGSRFYFSIPDPEGEDLLELFLKDAQDAAAEGAPLPSMFSIAAAFEGGAPGETIESVMKAVGEAVEIVLANADHVRTPSSIPGETLVAFAPNERLTEEAARKNIVAALDDVVRKSPGLRVRTALVRCTPDRTPSQCIVELRKSTLGNAF